MAHHSDEKCVDIQMLIRQVQRLEDSLPRDDLGNPAFDKHREYHTGKQRTSEIVKQYQHEVTKRIIVYGLSAIITLLGAGYSKELADFLKVFLP